MIFSSYVLFKLASHFYYALYIYSALWIETFASDYFDKIFIAHPAKIIDMEMECYKILLIAAMILIKYLISQNKEC